MANNQIALVVAVIAIATVVIVAAVMNQKPKLQVAPLPPRTIVEQVPVYGGGWGWGYGYPYGGIRRAAPFWRRWGGGGWHR